jgi:hypothetical protein
MVGMALVFLGLAALRPVIDTVALNTRLAVAQQSLITYRTGLLSYLAQQGGVPEDLVTGFGEASTGTGGEEAIPAQASYTSLGEALLATKKVDRISFPLGEKFVLPEDMGPLVARRPEIWGVSLAGLEEHFQRSRLFPSASSARVAVLVVPFLNQREAEGIQTMLSNLSAQTQEGGLVNVGDCFFTPSPVEGRLTGWIYLSDL